MTTLDINPADATVFAPNLPRSYDTHREDWNAPAKLTVSILLHAPYYQDDTDPGDYRASQMPGGVGGAFPDPPGGPEKGQVAKVSQYEFGLTNGLFRLQRIADQLGVPYAVALDASGCRNIPGLARHVGSTAGEVVLRGESATSIIDSRMSAAEESAYIQRSLQAVRSAAGVEISGWFGPERGFTNRTTELLREAGLAWFGDWMVDDRPVPLDGSAVGLTALPFSLDCEDSFQLFTRGATFENYETILDDTISQLLLDAETVGPRFLGLSWAGWVLGQACYADVAERILTRLVKDPGVALVLPSEAIRDADISVSTN